MLNLRSAVSTTESNASSLRSSIQGGFGGSIEFNRDDGDEDGVAEEDENVNEDIESDPQVSAADHMDESRHGTGEM